MKLNLKANQLYMPGFLVMITGQLFAQNTAPPGSYYAPTVIQGQTINTPDYDIYPEYETYYGPSALLSPGTSNASMTINDGAFVAFKAGDEITLTDGFTAGDFVDYSNGGGIAGEFKAIIEKPLEVVVITPNETQLVDNLLHVKKWEKFEMAVRLPDDYENAIGQFFKRHFTDMDNKLAAVPITPYSTINPYKNLTFPNGTPELNPYAFDSLEIRFDFIGPSGIIYTKYGFFMREVTWGPKLQGYDGTEQPIEDLNNPLNNFHFHVRFAPVEETTGNQVWQIRMSIKAPYVSSLPPYSVNLTNFKCDPPDSDKHGYLKVNPVTHKSLQFDDGTGFFGMGENLIDQRNTFNADLMTATNGGAGGIFLKKNFDDHYQTIDDLAAAGANMIRLIMFGSNYAFMTEDLNAYDAYFSNINCIGNNFFYGNRQYWTRKMDELFDRCYEKNIYIQLNSLISFPQVWGEWGNSGHNMFFKKFVTDFDQNPNILTPNTLPIEHFFRNSQRKILNTSTEEVAYYWQRYFKYLMSRWGYSVNLAVLEPMGEVNQTMGYNPDNWVTDHLDADICANHRGIFTSIESDKIKNAINDWYSMIGHYLRDAPNIGGLNERYIPIEVSYTDYPLGFTFLGPTGWDYDWPKIRSHCMHYFNDQIDLIEMHRYSNAQNAFYNNFNLSKDIYDPAKFNSYPNVDLNNKPFACGELATSGSIEDPDNPTQSVTTCQYYNNYDISHHNEIWGSAFIGNFHSGFTWFTEVAHRYENSNPKPLPVNGQGGTARNINDQFDCFDVNLNIISSGNIKTTYQNFTPFKDFIATTNINFNDSWIPHGFYDDINVTSQNVECYYLTNTSESRAYGWIHNINYYWKNKYYYWADHTNVIPYYNLSGCNPSALSTGIVLEGLTPGSPYAVDFFYTRIGTPPLNFPQPTMLTADIDGKLIIDGSTLGTYLGCEDETADVAFSLSRYPNRSAPIDTTQLNSVINFSISPNPGNGLFYLNLQNIMESPYEIKIYDLSGRLISEVDKITAQSYKLNLTALAKGCYLLNISQNNRSSFSKIIIQ